MKRTHMPRTVHGVETGDPADKRKFPAPGIWRQTCPMGEVLVDDIVHTDYGQFDVVWGDGFGFDGDFDRFFDGQVNGLVGAADPNGF